MFSGTIICPPDKSIHHRAVIMRKILSDRGITFNINLPKESSKTCEDVQCTIEAMKMDSDVVDLGNSGTSARILLGVIPSMTYRQVKFIGDESLSRRPMKRVTDILADFGLDFFKTTNNELPLVVQPKDVGRACLPSVITVNHSSAQVKSCVLLTALVLGGPSITYTEQTKSRDHTERMLQWLDATSVKIQGTTTSLLSSFGTGGYINKSVVLNSAIEYHVPGDFSAAAFFIVGALITPKSDITLLNVGVNPSRTKLIDVLRSMGGDIELSNIRNVCNEPVADIRVKHSTLHGCDITDTDIQYMIDEFPILCVAMTMATTDSTFGIPGDLRKKESDRFASTREMLELFGTRMSTSGIYCHTTSKRNYAGVVKTHKDHRIAMSAIILGRALGVNVIPVNFTCINTSYPDFLDDLKTLWIAPKD